MSLEESGVPTVSVHTDAFARLAQSVAYANGMPTTRQTYVPQPIVDKSPADLRAYVEGEDPISNRPFMQEVIEGLSHPLNDNDITGVTFERTTPRRIQRTISRLTLSKITGLTIYRSFCRPKSA